MTRSLTLRATLALAGLLSLTGCPPAAGGGGNNGTPSELSQDEFLDLVQTSYAEVFCRAVFECPSNVDGVAYLGRFQSQAACEEGIFDLFPQDPFEDLRAGLDSGRVAYDGEAAAACKESFEAYIAGLDACSSIDDIQPEGCEEVVLGQVAVGGNCLNSEECADDGNCVNEGEACYGTCEAANTCGDAVCADGEYCDRDDTCQPKLDVGDACGFADDCTATSEDVRCLVASGESEGTCTAYGTVAAGEACGFDDDFCASGLSCDDNGVCASVETLTLGDAGDECDFEERPCSPGLACTNVSISQMGFEATCGPPRTAGEECYVFLECEVGLTCVGSSIGDGPPVAGTCGDLFADGEACDQDFDCASSFCNDGVCAPNSTETCQVP
jgi:hypothetical protein